MLVAIMIAVTGGDCASAASKKTRRATTIKTSTRKTTTTANTFSLRLFCETVKAGCGRVINLKSVDDIVAALTKAGYTQSEGKKETVIFNNKKTTEIQYVTMTSSKGDIVVNVCPYIVKIDFIKEITPTRINKYITGVGYQFDACGPLGDEYWDNFSCSDAGTHVYQIGSEITIVNYTVNYDKMNGYM